MLTTKNAYYSNMIASCEIYISRIVHGLLAVGLFVVGQFAVKKNAIFG